MTIFSHDPLIVAVELVITVGVGWDLITVLVTGKIMGAGIVAGGALLVVASITATVVALTALGRCCVLGGIFCGVVGGFGRALLAGAPAVATAVIAAAIILSLILGLGRPVGRWGEILADLLTGLIAASTPSIAAIVAGASLGSAATTSIAVVTPVITCRSLFTVGTLIARRSFLGALAVATAAVAVIGGLSVLRLRAWIILPAVLLAASVLLLIGGLAILIIIVVIVLLIEEILELIEGGADIGEMEERVLRLADIDERGVHSLHDAFDASEVNGADMALLIGNFQEDLGEAVFFSYGNAYLCGGRIDDDLFFHGWVG